MFIINELYYPKNAIYTIDIGSFYKITCV